MSVCDLSGLTVEFPAVAICAGAAGELYDAARANF
jgi:hypothetical protein